MGTESGPESGSLCVLYIEDNHANLVLMQAIFASQSGIRVISASSAREGLEIASSQRPDLILLDLHLPDATGAEVLRQLKEDESTSAIPVVAVTADAREEQSERMFAAGADHYLTKPLDINALLEVVHRLRQRVRR